MVEGDIYYMNVLSNDCDSVLFVELLAIRSFFTTNLLNFSMYFFLLSQGVHKIDSRMNNKRQARKRRVNMTLSTFNQATLMDIC